MKVYLVGGAVRDQLLKLPISDYDWVVVGATPYDLIKLGFKKVGKGFPVFLHPISNEEYSLARIEQKTGKGYTGFSCYFSSKVSIEDDLSRRDLTINAIAKSHDGYVLDPCCGINDIKNKLLKHISISFVDDPLRVFRVARFLAQLYRKKFTIAQETKILMKKIVDNNELSLISNDRIWKETEKALKTSSPNIYFEVLKDCGALSFIFSDFNMNLNFFFDKFSFLILKNVSELTEDIYIRFSALCSDFIRNLILFKNRKFFRKFIICNTFFIEKICGQFYAPNKIKKFAVLFISFYLEVRTVKKFSPRDIIKFFYKFNCWKHPERINQFSIFCKAISSVILRGHKMLFIYNKFILKAFEKVQCISIKKIISKGFKGCAIKNELFKKRLQILIEWYQNQNITFF